jgi:hypothetical protein
MGPSPFWLDQASHSIVEGFQDPDHFAVYFCSYFQETE